MVGKTHFARKLGATCTNSNYSWSFINKDQRFVLFGAWEDLETDGRQLILSEKWKVRHKRRQPGFSQSIRHIEHVVEEDFKLFTFRQKRIPGSGSNSPARTKSFIEEKVRKCLVVENGNYYATEYLPNNKQQAQVELPGADYQEGETRSVTLTVYERNPKARAACLEKYGYCCAVCEFDFQKTYGELGREFIHVHHLVPVSSRGTVYTIRPLIDLRPVCPNCHAMIHRNGKNRKLEEVMAAIQRDPKDRE